MSKPIPQEVYVRKLVKIIHQKQKQLAQYRNVLKKDKKAANMNIENQPPHASQHQQFRKIETIDQETHHAFTMEMTINRNYLKEVTEQLQKMGDQIALLQNGLDEEESKTIEQEKQINLLKAQLHRSEAEARQHMREKEALMMEIQSSCKQRSQEQNSSATLRLGLSRAQLQISDLRDQVQANQQYLDELSESAMRISSQIQQGTLTIQTLQGELPSGKTIMCQSTKPIVLPTKAIYSVLEEVVNWQRELNQKDEELLQRELKLETDFRRLQELQQYEVRSLDDSIQGLSRFIRSATCIHPDPNKGIFEDSLYRKQEEDLLRDLEEEMKKEYSQECQLDNEKLVELSQFRHTLKATKDVNMALFSENTRLDQIVQDCKAAVKLLIGKKAIKGECKQQLSKILGINS